MVDKLSILLVIYQWPISGIAVFVPHQDFEAVVTANR